MRALSGARPRGLTSAQDLQNRESPRPQRAGDAARKMPTLQAEAQNYACSPRSNST